MPRMLLEYDLTNMGTSPAPQHIAEQLISEGVAKSPDDAYILPDNRVFSYAYGPDQERMPFLLYVGQLSEL